MLEMSVKTRVLKVLAEIFGEEGKGIELDAKIGTDLALTSLERMTLFIALEDEFDRTIPEQDVEGLQTVGEVVDFIQEKIAV